MTYLVVCLCIQLGFADERNGLEMSFYGLLQLVPNKMFLSVISSIISQFTKHISYGLG